MTEPWLRRRWGRAAWASMVGAMTLRSNRSVIRVRVSSVERDTHAGAGVVHEHVQLPPPVDGGADDELGRVLVADVDGESGDARMHGRGLLQGCLTPADTEDVRPRLGHGDRRGPADTGSCSGDDHDAAVERAGGLVLHGESPHSCTCGHVHMFDVPVMNGMLTFL